MTVIPPPPAASSSTRTGEVRLAVRGLRKVFADDPRPALEMLHRGATKAEVLQRLNVSVGVVDAGFEIRAGEIFVIMGLSGSGKSTILRLLNRLVEPSEGEIRLDGRDLTRLTQAELVSVLRRDMSMVFQSFALLPNRNALENAAFGLEIAGMPRLQRRKAALAALERVGLGAYADRYPNELSGGMQQRVGLARALAKNPTIMLMDEAFSALDPLIRSDMQDELLRLQREDARTIVFISHDAEEAMRLADRIAVMEDGRIAQIGTPAEILRAPADDYVRAFFRGVDASRLLRARDIARPPSDASRGDEGEPARFRYRTDAAGHFRGVLAGGGASALFGLEPVAADAPLNTLLGRVAAAPCPLPVVEADGRLVGVISRTTLLAALDRCDGVGLGVRHG
ncbi:glycine/betaine ABC transporter ATP-binding protein [Azospirillum thiophilum]|uniref:Quaternary amine transport ATP-binding protein n=1 Tax=Azospirillum thiophilum TaxID=528244 RepID=A0AAC9EXU3_9PROT|nr:glycine betaine/L-proline ABC transporter ATP-binding protein [Azospirillum thiophilum]ALG72727.1 glycine/betaine ABC transporter ATP-binding protein [Azospirillum thiophilum]KJR64355.1 glycine/betaine ABC transporter ATP-binding protein [Azospirillum thiophilum]